MPSAPSSFSLSIFCQKVFSSITEWSELHPFSASGNMVGLFIPGSWAIIWSSLSLGAFSNIYLLLRAASTAFILNTSLSSICRASALMLLTAISTATDVNK